MKNIKSEIFEIVIRGEKWYYYIEYNKSIIRPSGHSFPGYHRTYFFKKYKIITKTLWFGLKKQQAEEPYVLFSLDIDVRNAKYSKEDINKLINEQLKILDRKEEIKRNGII